MPRTPKALGQSWVQQNGFDLIILMMGKSIRSPIRNRSNTTYLAALALVSGLPSRDTETVKLVSGIFSSHTPAHSGIAIDPRQRANRD